MVEVEDNIGKENEDVHNIITVIKPAVFVENFFGIFRFSVADKKLLPPNKIIKAYGAVITIIFTVITVLFLQESAIFNGKSNFSDIMDDIGYLLLILQYIAAVVLTLFSHTKINIQIVSKFAELDKTINIDYNRSVYKTSRNRTLTYLIILFVSHIIMTSYVIVSSHVTILNFISGQLFFFQKLEILIFCKMIGMLKYRLHVVNEYIKNFIDETENNRDGIFTVMPNSRNWIKTYNWIGRPSDKNIKIHDLGVAYDHVGNISALINDVFNFQLLTILISTFFCILLTIWKLFYIYLSGNVNIKIVVLIAIWSASTMLNIIFITFTCESLLTVRGRTKVLVNKLVMNYNLPNIMRNQAKAFMDLIEAWPLTISVYDMFNIDITLILKFISISTTYLIVIVQISHFI